ncbi:MAG TPA: TPM domain-containing protein [Bacteroidia bacterium]
MKLTEKILGALTILAIVFKLFLIPGGGVLFVIATQLLACLYFFFGFALFNSIRLRNIFSKAAYASVSTMKIVGAALMGIPLSMICVGITFKIQMWPGAQAMLIAGMTPAIIIFIISYIKYLTTKHVFYIHAMIRCGIFVAVAILLFFTSAITLMKIEYRDHPEFIKAFEASWLDQENEDLYKKMELERNRVYLEPGDFKQYEQEYLKEIEAREEELAAEQETLYPKRKFPLTEGWTNDFEHILSKEEISTLNNTVTAFTARTGISIHLVTIDSIERHDTSDLAGYHLMDEWMSSEDEEIVLVIVSKAKREVAIFGDDITEEILTGPVCKEIMAKNMTQSFRNGNFFKGLQNGLGAIIRTLDNPPENL